MSSSQYHRLREKNSFVGTRLRIPHVLHDELRNKLGGESPDTALSAWYAALDAEAEQTKAPIPDVFKWVRPKFEEWASESAEDAEMAKFMRGEV